MRKIFHIAEISCLFCVFCIVPECIYAQNDTSKGTAEFDTTLMLRADMDSVILDTFITGEDSIELWSQEESFGDREVVNSAFQVGEKLTFSVGWQFVKAGKAVMSIPEMSMIDGRECYHIISETKSNRMISLFYKVRDKIETYIDSKGLYSRKFKKRIREGGYKKNYEVDLYQEKSIAKSKKKEFKIPPYLQDVLSGFYYVRTLPKIEVGQDIKINVVDNNKMYPLKIRVYKKERVKVDAGVFDCVVLEPLLKSEGLFRRKGRVWVWMTDDEKHIPVLVKSKAFIGSVIVELKKIEGVGTIPAKVK